MDTKEKTDAVHSEHVSAVSAVSGKHRADFIPLIRPQPHDENKIEEGQFVEDKKLAQLLVRRIDLRILPLCAFLYMLNYLYGLLSCP